MAGVNWKSVISAVAGAVLLSACGGGGGEDDGPDAFGPAAGSSASSAAAGPLVWNDHLAQAAAGHSSDMASRNFVSHTGSDGSSAADRARSAGYRGAVGENLAGGQTSVRQVMNELLRSPAHCANLMDPAYRTTGAACVSNRSTTYKTHWTQMLGR